MNEASLELTRLVALLEQTGQSMFATFQPFSMLPFLHPSESEIMRP